MKKAKLAINKILNKCLRGEGLLWREQISNSHETSLVHKDIDKLSYVMQVAF